MLIGRCIGETTPLEVNFISKEMPQIGEYVYLKYNNQVILGMVESTFRGNLAINEDIFDPDHIKKIVEIEKEDYYIRGNIKILGDINNLLIPRIPAPPGTEILRADDEILNNIFNVNDSLNIGKLINNENINVSLDIDKMINRHLAILAMTGAGKSNTVSIIIDELLKYNACILVFDMHSEYSGAKFNNGSINLIKPEINPNYMEFSELQKLSKIKRSAFIQERYFREAFNNAQKKIRNSESSDTEFIYLMKTYLEDKYNKDQEKPIIEVINKLNDVENKYTRLINHKVGDILTLIKPNRVNIIELGHTDENVAEVVVSHVLRKLLKDSKCHREKSCDAKLKVPIFCILEEAHILAPNDRDIDSKYWIKRISREGRKFGLGLCLVSQSPKNVDREALSQMNNMIILRLVSPGDQSHLRASSENLSEDLLRQLPSLNIGEAVILGLMVKIPIIAKIDEFKGKSKGNDINISKEWKDFVKKDQIETKQHIEEDMNLGGNY